MRNSKRLFAVALAAVFALSLSTRAQTPIEPTAAATTTPPAAPAETPEPPIVKEFKVLFEKISEKLKTSQEQPTEAAFADELKAFDAILAKYSSDKSDDAASVHLMKARLYLEVFDENEKAVVILKQIKTDYPNTQVAANLDQVIASIEKQMAAADTLAIGKQFPAFNVTDLTGKAVTLDTFKGKIVLIDFWATWCGPCVAELPHVQAAYEKFHGKGFEVLGISLDRDRAKLDGFLEKNKMPWTHHYDPEGKLAQEYGINAIPATFLVDGEGKIIAKDLRGDALEKELAKLLP
jgi:peroxiredoxin